jgi:collagenase-like PrtC family protease
MSSWVGGHSGNRGTCTAPCRVNWTNNNKQFPYFSMKDLSLVENLKELKEIGISSLKIEGRLKTPIWVKTITSIYRNAIDNLTDTKNLELLNNELKKYSAREKDKGHIKKHNNLIGKNEEWENYRKLEGELEIPEKNIFNEINEITLNCENGLLKILININDKTSNLEFIISPLPKKAAPVKINNLSSFINNGEIHNRKFEIQINNGEIETSSSFLNKVSNEIISEIRKLINKNEELPQLSNEILNFINPIKQDIKRKEILGDKPDKILILSDQIKYFTNEKNISEITISLTSDIDLKLIKMLGKKCKIILSIPAILFEKQALKLNNLIDYYIENGFCNFEANSYTGIQCLSEKKCNKSLGYEFPVFNHLSAQYFYSLGFESVFVSPEADSSTYKALSSFTNGKIDCLVFAKLALFQSRVQSDFFINNAVFKDKFTELECFKIMDLNYFVSKKPFSLIGNNFKKENIFFDRLICDLRFFNNPDKIYTQITGNNFNFQETNSFNFNTKLL